MKANNIQPGIMGWGACCVSHCPVAKMGTECPWTSPGESVPFIFPVQFSSVTQSCPTLCNPMDCSTPGFPVHHSRSLLKLMSIESMILSNCLILYHSLPLLPSILPSIRVFSNESVLRIRWPKDWSFSFSISPSNEIFRTDFL